MFGLSEDRDPTSELFTVLIMTSRKDGETMNARDLIVQADEIRQGKNLSQAGWSRAAGLDDAGTAICRIFNRGDCKLSTMVQLIAPFGYELKLVKREDVP